MQPLQFIDLLILAMVEGVADILPVDSTGHALLMSWWLHWRAGPIAISIHFAAALTLALFLWRDLALIVQGLWHLRRKRHNEPGVMLLVKLSIAAAPFLIVSRVAGGIPAPGLDAAALVGGVTILCAIVMAGAEHMSITVKRIEHVSLTGVLVIGCVQLLGLLPGIGRVAAMATAARVLGMERDAALRFTLLVQIPILLGQAGWEALDGVLNGWHLAEGDLLAAAVTVLCVLPAAVLGMKWFTSHGLFPFAVYRLLLGVILLGVAFF